MFESLAKLAQLPSETQVYCGHEYTLSNAAFAWTVDAQNQALAQRIADAKSLRQRGLPTVPSTIGIELACNPFMRAKSAEELGALRRQKDEFRA
jgi:hydroxyacylglutathione hydrolase